MWVCLAKERGFFKGTLEGMLEVRLEESSTTRSVRRGLVGLGLGQVVWVVQVLGLGFGRAGVGVELLIVLLGFSPEEG